MPQTIEELERDAQKWLKAHRGSVLPRTLYLIGGFSDEAGSCWQDIDGKWGPETFPDWSRFVLRLTFPPDGIFPAGSARAGQTMGNFLDFGDRLRELIFERHPNQNSKVGEYDLLCHSMAGLDAFAALVELSGDPGLAPQKRIARAFNFITCDTPFAGIPSADVREKFPDVNTTARRSQCRALAEKSPPLIQLRGRVERLLQRIERLTCFKVRTSFVLEVPPKSADLLGDSSLFSSPQAAKAAREEVRYRSPVIRGAVHSGQQGITKSVIAAAEIFKTLLDEA